MRKEAETKAIPIYNVVEDEYGELIEIEKTGEEVRTTITLYADEGKRIVKKGESKPLGVKLTLGTGENSNDYEEIII